MAIVYKKNSITSYKGFDKDMKCRNFQYEIGKEYEMGSDVEVCKRGFHACENPMDVLNYYKCMFNDRYCVVEQSGNIDRATDNTKIVSSKIKVKTEIGWEGLFKFGIKWLREITNPENVKTIDTLLNDNDDDYAQISSSSNNAKVCSIGDYAHISSSGGSAHIGSIGDYAQIGSSGVYAQISSSGNNAKVGSSGDYAHISSGGNYTKIDSTGETSVIMCTGRNSVAKAKVGSLITLAEWGYSFVENNSVPLCVKTEYVDGERIKEDTWYKLKNGEFVEAEP